MNAAQSGMTANKVETPVELIPLITKIEESIKRRVAIGVKISYEKLKQEMMQRFENAKAIDHVSLVILIFVGHLKYDQKRRVLTSRRQEDSCKEEVIYREVIYYALLILNHKYVLTEYPSIDCNSIKANDFESDVQL